MKAKQGLSSQSHWVTVPIAVVSATYVWFVFLPGKSAIDALKTERGVKQQAVLSAGETQARIRQVEQESLATSEYCQAWSGGGGGSAEVARLYGAIAEATRQAGVSTTRFAPEAPTKFEQMQRLSLRLGCQGSFAEIGAFVESIEGLPYRIWIEDLTMERSTEDGKDMSCEMVLAIFAGCSEKSN